MNSCTFCTLPPERIIRSTTRVFAVRDLYPVSPGHTLVIPYTHATTLHDVGTLVRLDLLAMVDGVQRELLKTLKPDGFNIGVNQGEAAGQTVPHLHIHVIPRYAGDVPNPRGGIRGVIPGKSDY